MMTRAVAGGLMLSMVAFGSADALVKVEYSGTTVAAGGGPYNVSGSFIWDPSVSGATTDTSMVPLDDPGVSDFTLSFTGGDFDFFFAESNSFIEDPGSFDLSTFGAFDNIVNSAACVLAAPGACGGVGPAAGVFLPPFLSLNPARINYRADGASSFVGTAGNQSYVVTPVPAALPLLLSAVAGLAWVRRRQARELTPEGQLPKPSCS